MEFTSEQLVSLVNLMKMGADSAAVRLSILMKENVEAASPNIGFVGCEGKTSLFDGAKDKKIVYQTLTGKLSGTAVWMLTGSNASKLVDFLLGDMAVPVGLDREAMERDALTEVGNIIISTCISVLSNILGDSIYLSVAAVGEQETEIEISGCGDNSASYLLTIDSILKSESVVDYGKLYILMDIESAIQLSNSMELELSKTGSKLA